MRESTLQSPGVGASMQIPTFTTSPKFTTADSDEAPRKNSAAANINSPAMTITAQDKEISQSFGIDSYVGITLGESEMMQEEMSLRLEPLNTLASTQKSNQSAVVKRNRHARKNSQPINHIVIHTSQSNISDNISVGRHSVSTTRIDLLQQCTSTV